MKRQFLRACLFIFGFTTSFIHASSNPTMSRVYGDQFTPQVADSQSAATVGTLDATFGTNGSLAVTSSLSNPQAAAIQTLPDGTFITVLTAGTSSVAQKYNAEGSLVTYGTTGVATLGGSTTAGARAVMLDAQGRLLVSGGGDSGSAGWIRRVSTDGTVVTSFTTGTAWRNICGIAQQSSGKIIAVGFNNTNAQIGRYNVDGTLDTTFGAGGTGFVPFDGTNSLPTSPHGLYGVVVDSSDNVYVLTLNSAGGGAAYMVKLNATGAWVGTYGELTTLSAATAAQQKIAINNDGNIILAAAVGGVINVTALTTTGTAVGGFTNFSSSSISGNTFTLFDLKTTSDNSIYLVGSNATSINMAVIRLIGSSGALDTAFNPSLGYNFFNISGPSTSSQLQGLGIAPTGQLYGAGYQVNSGTTTSYVSRLNNTQYVSQVAQFPLAQEQGILDQTFGNQSRQSNAGVTTPYNGLYGSSLMQTVQSMVEVTTTSGEVAGVPPVGDILVGMNGFTDSSSNSNMMFAWLTSQGAVDTSINSTGYLTLANSLTNEYLTSILQGPSGIVYVAGYASTTLGGASTGALLRAYSTASTSTWTAGGAAWSAAESTAGYKAACVGYQASATRTLLFVAESSTVGHISGYTSSGALDSGFGSSGIIAPTAYGLHMGPCYSALVQAGDDIVAAYKDSLDNTVRVVDFLPNGSGLNTSFGTAGVSAALFSGFTNIAANNIRMSFNKNGDILVAAVNGADSSLLFTLLDGETGLVDTTFGTAGVLTVAITGALALQLKQIVGVSDGNAVATFYDDADDDTMYISRITLLGALDTTFDSQGSQPGVLAIQIGNETQNYNARALTASLVQSTAGANQGNIVMGGYESMTANESTPVVMRSYGTTGTTEVMSYPTTDTGIPGTVDIEYDLNSLLGTGAGKVIFAYPGTNAYQGTILVGIDNGVTSKVARIDITTNTLDTTFGAGGIYTIAGSLPGITTLSIDAQNNILVGGSAVGAGWAQVLSPTASSAVSFTLPSLTSVNQILQQKSGRYIVAGATSSNNALVAFQDKVVAPATTFAVDPTFNPLAVTSAPAGSFYIGTTTAGIFSIAINSDDTILAVYRNATPVLAVAKITANGSGLVAGFGTAGTLLTTINPDSSGVSKVAIDSTGKVVVAASSGTGVNLKIQRFTSAGAVDTTWSGTGITSNGPQTITNAGTAGVALTGLLETSSQQTVLVGYNTAGGNGRLFAARLAADGSLDASWNTTPTGTDSAGVLTYASNSATRINGATITISGLIASIGQQAGGTSGDPILTYVYGDNYVTQVAQNPLEAAAGTLDSTIPGNVSGALALSGLITGVPQKIYIYTTTINSSPNGAMLIASADSTNVYLKQLNADLSVNTNFATSTSNVVTMAATGVTITDMYVANGANDTAQPIYLVGYTSGNAQWAARVAFDGSSFTIVSPISTLNTTGSIRQSSNSRVLISGYNGSLGSVVAYNAAINAIDKSFGNGSGTGYYTTATASSIAAMTLDNSDRIYIAYRLNATTINVQRLLENGTALDTTFGTSGTVTITGAALSASQIKMAIDLTNSQLIIAAQDGTSASNFIQVARFNLSNGAAAGSIVNTVLTSGAVFNLSDLFIDNNSIASAYPNIYVIGYTISGNSVVARIATTSTTIALDTSYGIAGVANLSEGAMTVVTAAALDQDRRVYLVGSNGSTAGYLGRFFGDYYWTEKYPAILKGVIGTIDLTLAPYFTGGIDLSGQTGWSSLASGYQARAIIENQNGDGTSFIAFGNGTNVIVGKVNADMNPVTTFGTAGLTTAQPMVAVNNISLDNAGNILVSGNISGPLGIGYIISANGTSLLATTATTTAGGSATGSNVFAQQKSGRYIIAGTISNYACVYAYKNITAVATGILPLDPTFGQLNHPGFYATVSGDQFDDMCIDSNDYMYIVSSTLGTGAVKVTKLTPQGQLSDATNTPSAQVWSVNPIITSITATQPARVAINAAGNIVVGASTSSGIATQLYNGGTGVAIGSLVSQTPGSAPILTRLVGSIGTQNEFYGLLYNSTPAVTVFALTSAGALDTAFGASGLATTIVQSPVQARGLSIQPDGKVVVAGYTSTPTTNPIALRFYGYPYMSQYAQAPDQVAAGIFDTTLWPTSGALNLDGYAPVSTSITTLNGSSVARIYEYIGSNNGKALLLFSGTNSGADSVLARVNIDLTLDTTFNGSGFVTITGQNNARALFVDSNSNIYVAGGATTSWIRVYSNTGVLGSGWTTAPSLSAGAYGVGVQSTGRVILSGKNTNGTLYGYKLTGLLDTTFGVNGVVDMGGTSAITGLTIDSSGNIITAAVAAGSVVLKKASASGSTVTSLTGGTAIATATGNAKVVLDTAGNIITASATTAGFTIARYNNDATGTNRGSQVTIAAGGSSTSVLGNIYATSDGNITLVGYETTGNTVVARIVSSPNAVSNSNLILDTANFNAAATTGVPGVMQTVINSAAFVAMDAIIGADDRIMIAGTQASDPYLARVFGDVYATYVSQSQSFGVAGTINTTFGTNGVFDESTLNALLVGAQGKAILPLANGGYYQVFDTANSAANSILIKTIASGALDTTYNNSVGGAIPGIAGSATSPNYAPLGVNSILQDGSNNVLLAGSTGGAGWLRRYTSAGVLDTAFGASGAVVQGVAATAAVEQTLGRYIVAGANGSGAALFAYKSVAPSGTPGFVDTTFNAGVGGTPGYIQIGSTNTMYNVIADRYDRLIFAVLNTAGTAVDLYRLTPTGELDATFGTNGKVTGAITGAAGASSVRVVIDSANNIVVVSNSSTSNTFSVHAFDNGVLVTPGANGAAIYAQLNISSLTGPSVTSLVAGSDGKMLVLGTQTAPGASWIARITAGGLLDTTFNPAAVGGIAGVFQYAGSGNIAHTYNGLAINASGTLGMFGYETATGPVYTSQLISVYDDPFAVQQAQSPNAKPVGTNDRTLGVSVDSYNNNGITFYGVAGGSSTYGQVAQAVALYDNNNIVVAVDGGATSGGASQIFINMFDNDGLLNTSFNTAGRAAVLSTYQNQYVSDMITFTTVSGVHKAIVAGYVRNSALNTNDSLLLQYVLTPGANALDTANFGGFNGNPSGVAFGDGQKAFVVGQQSTGRIVVGGLSQDNLGLLLGYTATGKLDTSFGNDGYQSVNTGATGIYSHAIDSVNRVVIAYNNAGSVNVARFLPDGSGLDSSFTTPTPLISTVTSNSNLKVAIGSVNNIAVAAVTNGGNQISFKTYAAAGGTATFTADVPYSSLGAGSSSASYVLARLIVDALGNVIAVAYDSNSQQTLVIRLTSSLVLDTTFNGTGYILYQSAGGSVSQVAKDAMVHPDGRIIIVGSEL